jgi:murein DD-endopeptidase MepM/ murein hydrolase activator NlpD
MQVLITHGSMARTRVLHFTRTQLLLALALLVCVLLLLSGTVYHFVFLKAAREGWPVVSGLVRLVVRDEIAERDRFLRDNLDAMAQRVGEVEAKVVRLAVVGERVSGLVGIQPEELLPQTDAPSSAQTAPAASAPRPAATGTSPPAPRPAKGAAGGPYVPWAAADRHRLPALERLLQRVSGLDEAADRQTDLFVLAESRLMEAQLSALMVPNSAPVNGPVGSGFGFRSDPFTGRNALHTGLDFPADVGTPIHAAAGGLVVQNTVHPAYGKLLEIDHGNGLSTLYAHCSEIHVPLGAPVKQGDLVARVGNTGRSTGPHLHFEVLLRGVPQNPRRFLNAAPAAQARAALAPVRR